MAVRSQWVTCAGCGKQFDVLKTGGSYNRQFQKYFCDACTKAGKNYAVVKKGGWWANHWQIPVGALCIVSSFTVLDNISTFLMTFLIGAAFIAWYIIAAVLRTKNAKAQVSLIIPDVDDGTFICKYCGATSHGSRCEYCDSPRD